MRVTMLKSLPGSPDGNEVVIYEEGSSPVMPDKLANIFIGIGAAKVYVQPIALKKRIEKVEAKKEFKKEAPVRKAFPQAPSNKASNNIKRGKK